MKIIMKELGFLLVMYMIINCDATVSIKCKKHKDCGEKAVCVLTIGDDGKLIKGSGSCSDLKFDHQGENGIFVGIKKCSKNLDCESCNADKEYGCFSNGDSYKLCIRKYDGKYPDPFPGEVKHKCKK